MFTVIGSGFGLYGYLPALVETFGGPVLLPEAYREKVAARRELRPYADAIQWTPGRDAALNAATGAVIALPPRYQREAVNECLSRAGVGTLILEKPLAENPAVAIDLLASLRNAGKRLRIGYSLLHTSWSDELDALDRSAWAIRWEFMANHFSADLQNWKRVHAAGGGVLRFFGIHLLPLLARHGYDTVLESSLGGAAPGEPERWQARFRGAGRAECTVQVDSRAPAQRFAISVGGNPWLDLQEPFEREPAAPHGGDRRIGILKRVLATLREGDETYMRLYDRANTLWTQVEAASQSARPCSS